MMLKYLALPILALTLTACGRGRTIMSAIGANSRTGAKKSLKSKRKTAIILPRS